MKIAILTANLGDFDENIDPVKQDSEHEIKFHRWTDDDFPPIAGLTPRLQYRIPKLFGWEMFQGYDIYVWMDASFTLSHPDSVNWLLEKLGDKDAAFFKHPQRKTIKEEVDHVEKKLKEKHPYMVPRYENGLHKEMYKRVKDDEWYEDNVLYTSTAFIYRNNTKVQNAMEMWWYFQSRYFTVDQISQPYVMWLQDVSINLIEEDQYKCDYLQLVSKHK